MKMIHEERTIKNVTRQHPAYQYLCHVNGKECERIHVYASGMYMYIHLYANPTPPHPHVVTKQVEVA